MKWVMSVLFPFSVSMTVFLISPYKMSDWQW